MLKITVTLIISLVISFIISFVISFVLSVIIHELGHMFFGLMGGYRCKGITIFQLSILKLNNRLNVTRDRSDDSTVFGQCIMYPAADTHTHPRLCSMGGIYMNIIASLIFLIPVAMQPEINTFIFCLTTSLTNISLAVISQWFGGPTSDGATSRQLKNAKEKVLYDKIVTVGQNSIDGISFGRMQFDEDFKHDCLSSMSAEYSLYRYYSYLENADAQNVLRDIKVLETYHNQTGIERDVAIERAILETLENKEADDKTKSLICGSTKYADYIDYLLRYAKKNARISLLYGLAIDKLDDTVMQNIESATYSGDWVSTYNTFMKRAEIVQKLSEAQ